MTVHSGRGSRLLVLLGVMCALPLATAQADYLVANRKLSLKAGPSAASDPLKSVETGQVLSLASTQLRNGYYEVSLASGGTAWVYRGFVVRREGDPPGAAPSTTPSSGASGGTLRVHVINVGQGDAILITCPDGHHQMLIDSGDTRYPGASQSFKNAMTLLQAHDDPIEVVVSTHPHSDRIGNMEWVIRQYQVGTYVDDGIEYDSTTFRNLGKALAERGVHQEHVNKGAPEIHFCTRPDVSATILRPQGFGDLADPNDNSVVIRLDYGKDSFLFVGDAMKEEEQQLLGDPVTRPLLDCEFLKVGHHGSDTSSTKPFLDAVTPEIAAISAGEPGISTNAGYMHPRRSTVELLLRYVRGRAGPAEALSVYDSASKHWVDASVSGELYCTSVEGDLVFESEGHGISFHPSR